MLLFGRRDCAVRQSSESQSLSHSPVDQGTRQVGVILQVLLSSIVKTYAARDQPSDSLQGRCSQAIDICFHLCPSVVLIALSRLKTLTKDNRFRETLKSDFHKAVQTYFLRFSDLRLLLILHSHQRNPRHQGAPKQISAEL